MLTKESAKPETGQEGLRFANALRDVFVCGVILVDPQKSVAFLTDEARRMLGLSVQPNPAVLLKVLPAPLQEVVRETLAAGKPLASHQVEVEAAGRGVITLHVSSLLLPPEGAGTRVAVVVNDFTAAKGLEQNLWHFDRLANLGTLSASMAHEIKNALVAGKTFVDLLLEKHRDAELADVVRREMGRIDAIVSRMLNFVGPARPRFSEVRVHEVLEHSLRLVQPQLKGKFISLNRSFQAATDRVHGDDQQLQQAFVNLFLNALEVMGNNGMLTVITEILPPTASTAERKHLAGHGQLGVTIQDSGPGILPEDLARVFEPFFTTKSSGTGLGLPITRQIIEEHRGGISVESEPNQGTTFRITLPTLDIPP
jgi:two-component system sensor histidine kinase HydH